MMSCIVSFKNYRNPWLLWTVAFLLTGEIYGDSPSTWTGDVSFDMNEGLNWSNGVPNGGIAVFDGNGTTAPLSNQDPGPTFDEMQFIADTEISVISNLYTNGAAGVVVNPGVVATFDVYEHQPMIFPSASLTLSNGPLGNGGGTALYNLEGYGQLYAYSGADEATTVNIALTGGNNYFKIQGPGSNVFDNVSSDADTDEIDIDSGSNLTIRNTATNSISAVISGEGSLTKVGSGVLVLNNDNTYTGGTLVNQGTVQVNGSLVGDLTIAPGGSLGGVGFINGTLLLAGNISPGNSIGTLNLANFISTSSSVYFCEVNSSGASDQIIATGSARLGGALEIIPLDLAFSSSQTYSIIQAGSGISGMFSSVQSSVPALKFLNYGTNNVFLSYLPLSAAGLEGNSAAAANCFVLLEGSDPNIVSGNLLSLSIPDIQKAFNHIQPSQFSGQTWTQMANMLLVSSGYSKHLKEFCFHKPCSDQYKTTLWVDTLGRWERQKSKEDQLGYHDWATGFSLGADTSYEQFRFGGALSYTYSKINWNSSFGNGQVNSCYGGGYGSWSNNTSYAVFSIIGAYNSYDSSRYIPIGNIKRYANGSHHGWEGLASLEGGANFKSGYFTCGPFVKIDYIYLWQQGYEETQAKSLNLQISSRHDQLLQSQIGIALRGQNKCDPKNKNGTVVPNLELSYINQSPLARSDYYASFENSSCEFNVSGWNFQRNLGALTAGLTYLSFSEKIGVSLQYDGQFGSRYYNQVVHLLLNVKY